MVVSEASINNIMSGIENTGGVKQHNHKKKLRQRFDIIRRLGQGTFGKVQLGINKETGQEVAIKTIKKSKIESDADLVRIRREIQIMSSVQHPNIIHIYEVFENKEKMVLVMEYAAGGELYDYLSERKVLAEDEARRIFRQIATACYYCHKHKICHRDLKLENILLDENNNAKIADFGLSNVFDDQRLLNTFCGSPLYASPEIVKGTPYHGPEVDCWSLGVLLYTLVYGAMPFDGSNFKRLVKHISQGDYFEPAKPSPASPLIKEMLTVSPKTRANIETICLHWWVNETYDENCLDISEDLANQTPVRLDVLLSLAPPPPQLESDKLMATGDVTEEAAKCEAAAPTRSQSAGSLMDIGPAERRIIDLINDEKISPKRKLESTVSTDTVNMGKGRQEKIVKDKTVADITSSEQPIPLDKSLTQTISKEMDVEQTEEIVDPSLQGAVCQELIEEAKKQPKIKKTLSTTAGNKVLEEIHEMPSQETVSNKENHVVKPAEEEKAKEESKAAPKKKIVKKKVLTDKDENSKPKVKATSPAEEEKKESVENKEVKEKENKESKKLSEDTKQVEEKGEDEGPSKPIERRKSRIFEVAEKFQNMISPSSESKPVAIEKPKKINLPGVCVGGFKKEFERKASLTSTSPPKIKGEVPTKKIIDVEKQQSIDEEEPIKTEALRNAVNIISSALDKEGTRKSKSRPCMMRKPPVPFGASGRSASGNIGMISGPLSPPIDQTGPKPFVKTVFDTPKTAEVKQVKEQPEHVEENKTSSAEITLKSATLPRRKTTKAEIKLNYPSPTPATMEFKTEMAHNVKSTPKSIVQKNEVVVPVASPPIIGFRTSLVEPEIKKSKERIIPISVERDTNRDSVQTPPAKPPVARPLQTQISNASSTRSGSISRQSTQDSDTETVASTGEPIKKSPREYIIPIAVEGGGYVTPRAGSLEPSENASSTSTGTMKSRFGRARRLNSRMSDRDSEEESPFTNLHRHSSFGKDSDNEESRNPFHMHRLRTTRPKRTTLEHNDSLSSGEEDDDEGFENFTAENLFSTLLSRVRDLTQRLNVEDGVRPGFPTSRLLSQFNHGTNFFNRQDPLSRHASLSRTFSRDRPESLSSNFSTPWRRSVSKDLASDIESVFNDPNSARPRGDNLTKNENLNLSDLDLKKLKLSDEDALALSYLTPSLSKKIQKQLLAQLAPSEARKLHRTLSSRSSSDNYDAKEPSSRRSSLDRLSTTLPRRYSIEKDIKNNNYINLNNINEQPENEYTSKTNRSLLPVKNRERPYHDFSVRSSSTGAEPRFAYRRPNYSKSSSAATEPKSYLHKNDSSSLLTPDSSISESTSRNDDSSYRKDTDSISELSSSISRPYSKYSTEKYTPRYASDTAKTEIKKPRRISRFLRPDFFDAPKEEKIEKEPPRPVSPIYTGITGKENVFTKDNIFTKEKKEKELETQKVLKEIRDKRKSRLSMRRERSVSREKVLDPPESKNNDIHAEVNKFLEAKNELRETKALLNNVSNNIKSLENSVQSFQNDFENIPTAQPLHDYVNVKVNGDMKHDYVNVSTDKYKENKPEVDKEPLHDYVNVKVQENPPVVIKKENVSRLARPKSYPAEKMDKEKLDIKSASPEKESKIARLRKGLVKQSSKEKIKKNDSNKNVHEEEKGHKNKLLQSIEKKLEKFRSNNMAATKDPEEFKALQEKKSTVENAIKRLREQSMPRSNDQCTESGLIKRAVSVEEMPNHNKPLQASRKSVTKILGLFKKYEEQEGKKKEKMLKKTKSKEKKSEENNGKTDAVINSNEKVNSNDNYKSAESNQNTDSSQSENIGAISEKSERPKSLLYDKVKHFQHAYNGARSDSVILNDKESKIRSKLPVNHYRRSLNLDNLPEPPKFYKNPSRNNLTENNNVESPDKRSLKLDFSRIPSRNETRVVVDHIPTTSHDYAHRMDHLNANRNSDDTSTLLSPSEDYMSCDSWSICSDLQSPLSPNGNMCSGDENESVIDRIRRKSFYTRFNEKKRAKKPSVGLYAKDPLGYKTPSSVTDYSSLDRRSFRSPNARRSSYTTQEPVKTDYKNYTRSSSLLNDYVNVPNRYQTYSSKIGGASRPNNYSMFSDPEDNALDDNLSTAKSKKYSTTLQPSRFCRTSVSPTSQQYFTDRTTPSSNNNLNNSNNANSEPV